MSITSAGGTGGQFTKAQIVPIDENSNQRTPIECMFNPREYTITRSVQYDNQTTDTGDSANKVFRGGQPATMTLELFFDTYARRQSAGMVEDVRRYTKPLWDLTRMDPQTSETAKGSGVEKKRPPMVLFQWGSTWHFQAVIKSMEQQFTLFMPDGTPVRSIIKVSLEQGDASTGFEGKSGSTSTFHISQGIRAAAGQRGFVGDLRQTSYGKGT
ncbi:hypothetical protein GCM10008959_17210 [Deinococcus seoulensis]|uniref:Contractile injection system tube protein N-terminal domain-containing protein n=1 Tax=Deinococcus seoulensis TaxID=1837379 RepID=A0ABQ2RQK9_9DEIO|nr:hypothetical protein [Deinococcus seoulensis]GGR56134.1 hypothetical protein GCM10008959_17210 [Deinococcus seoulensis]